MRPHYNYNYITITITHYITLAILNAQQYPYKLCLIVMNELDIVVYDLETDWFLLWFLYKSDFCISHL